MASTLRVLGGIGGLAVLVAGLNACGRKSNVPQAKTKASAGTQTDAASIAASPTPSDGKVCEPPAGVNNNPQTIDDFVVFMNALPMPLTLRCLVDALPHPLTLTATTSVTSLQPATSPNSPRFFFALGKLLVSIVPDGPGSKNIEFGQIVDDKDSIKGEIDFPIVGPVPAETPYKVILQGSDSPSRCLMCHSSSFHVADKNGVSEFSMIGIRPNPGLILSADKLSALNTDCKVAPDSDTPRCQVIQAIFRGDGFNVYNFPSSMITF